MILHFMSPLALMVLLACTAALAAGERRDLSPILEPIVRQHDVPGMVAAVVKGEKVIAIGAAGVRRRGGDEKVQITDQFHLGSCTKSMTATLCAMLVEKGKLSWETTIADVFPELKETMRPAWRNVTLRQLLTHRGGMPADLMEGGLWAMLWLQRDPVPARQMLLKGVLSHEPAAEPGTKYIYSNAGFSVAGHMAEHVMHKPWEQLMRERLFGPLKMTSAGFGAPGKAGEVKEPWGHDEQGKPVEPGWRADNPVAIGPAGTIHCSIEDWAKYIALHLRGDEGHAKLLKADTFRVLHTPPEGADYAMGWGVAERGWAGGTALTHAGSNTMWFCVTWLAPRRDFAVLVCCNQGGDEAARACDDVAAKVVTNNQFNPAK